MSIKISKFGKIRKADIALDGLTVIAGQNDTGKSTIGKALFSVIKSVIDFPQLYYELSQKKAFSKLSAILFEILKNDSKKSKALLDIRNEILNSIFDEKQQDVYKNIYSYLEQLSLYMDEAQVDDNIKEQIVNINKDLVKDIDNNEKFKEIAEYIFSKDFKRDYNNSVSKEQSKIDYSIGDSLVASLSFEKNRIELAHIDVDYKAKSFSDVTFIESPLYLEESHNSKSPYVEDLKNKISISKDLLDEKNNNVEILEQIDLVLGQGKFEYDKEKKQLKYKVSENASPLNIENIASGSKMFGLIYLLLKTGTLAKDSLLVFDEPENHLHPEWQIKLAKIIVTMVKNDFYVLLTSHSPTFIHALMKYGSECIARKNKVKFYLAEKVCEQNYSDLNEVEDVNRIFDNLTSPNDILYFG